MEDKISAIDTQEAGNHYKNQKVQPMELSYYLGATPAFCKLSKYIGRVKENQAEDLRKAYHCIESVHAHELYWLCGGIHNQLSDYESWQS